MSLKTQSWELERVLTVSHPQKPMQNLSVGDGLNFTTIFFTTLTFYKEQNQKHFRIFYNLNSFLKSLVGLMESLFLIYLS